MAEKKKLTAKEQKIVAKKSSGFDSNTKGLGLPQKSSKATTKNSGKPKYKNVDEAYRQSQLKEAKSKAERAKIKQAVKSVKKEATKSSTEKPSTKKVPVKPRGGSGMRGPISLGGSGGLGKIK